MRAGVGMFGRPGAVRATVLLAAVVAGASQAFAADKIVVRATEPPSLTVLVGETRLTLAGPEIREGSAKGKVPADYNVSFENWDPWPGGPKTGPANYVALSPRNDENNTLILGGLFRAIVPESVVVKSGDKNFKMEEDYKFNARWGQVSNLNGRLGKPGEGELQIAFKFATQRLDLLEVDGAGKVSIKAGKPAMVCPALPTPDAGQRAVAGIYVVPWKQGAEYVITPEDIYPIEPVPPVDPIHREALLQTKKKLSEGKEVKIAWLGDSVTLGAESGAWWDFLWTAKNLGYPSRVVVGLREQFPKATVTPIAGFQGGISARAAMGLLDKSVLPEKPDLVVIAFGLNDAAGPVKGPPTNPPEKYKEDMQNLIRKVKAAGGEVLLVVPFEPNPFLANHNAQRIPEYRKVLIDLAGEEGAGCADVYTEWMNQAKSGVPPYSQIHNWINHPGPEGHHLYAKVLLRFFE